jgi:serine/threonine protein kinase
MDEINCRGRTEVSCKTEEPNCRWAGRRGCIKRHGVIGGTRYRYIPGTTDIEEITEMYIPGTTRIRSDFEFVYSPEFDDPEPEPEQIKLSSGTYGIAFTPPFPCVNGKRYSAKYVGKVYYNTESADQEWKVAQNIKKIESGTRQKYFTYPLYQCEIELKNPSWGTPEDQLTKTEKQLLESFKSKASELTPRVTQHIMEYSGTTLGRFFEYYYLNKRNVNPDGTVTETPIFQTLPRIEFIRILENLFYAVKRLHDLGYVHLDIKPANIVISNTKRLRLLDFGLALKKEDFLNPYKNFLLESLYDGISPPENHMYSIVLLNDLTYKGVLNWLKSPDPADQDLDLKWFKYFQHTSSKTQTEEFIQIFKNRVKVVLDKYKNEEPVLTDSMISDLFTARNISKDELYKYYDQIKNVIRPRFLQKMIREITTLALPEFWRTHHLETKSDTYSIGTTMLRLVQRHILLLSKDDNPEAVRLFRELMIGLLSVNPDYRLDIDQAIKIVKEIKKTDISGDPFKKNIDPEDTKKRLLSNFGNNEIHYLKRLIK